jgi:CheY-like chemotaxis protein
LVFPMSNKERPRILLVDDDDELRDLIAEQLETAGYAVTRASNGEKALSLLATDQGPWFALVTDFNMPVLNGTKLILAILHQGLHFKNIVMISASIPEESIIKELFAINPFPILAKPFSCKELIRILNSHENNTMKTCSTEEEIL